VILSRIADPGDLLQAGEPALVLGVMREPWVRVYVPARVLPSIAVGAVAEIHPPGAGGRLSGNGSGADQAAGVGRVIAINPQAEYVTRTALTEEERADLLFGVKVAIDDPAGRFKPGLPVTVRLSLRGSATP
jgi:HlyD family secretion protein